MYTIQVSAVEIDCVLYSYDHAGLSLPIEETYQGNFSSKTCKNKLERGLAEFDYFCIDTITLDVRIEDSVIGQIQDVRAAFALPVMGALFIALIITLLCCLLICLDIRSIKDLSRKIQSKGAAGRTPEEGFGETRDAKAVNKPRIPVARDPKEDMYAPSDDTDSYKNAYDF